MGWPGNVVGGRAIGWPAVTSGGQAAVVWPAQAGRSYLLFSLCRQCAPPLPAGPPGPAAATGRSSCCARSARRPGAAAVQVRPCAWVAGLPCWPGPRGAREIAATTAWAVCSTCCPVDCCNRAPHLHSKADASLPNLDRCWLPPHCPAPRLGAVCGCLGDCCRAEGDAQGTAQHYQDSVRLLREAGQDPEVRLGCLGVDEEGNAGETG